MSEAKKHEGFTAEEKAAMKERAKELKASASHEDALRDQLAKIDELPEPDRALAKQVHEIIMAAAPHLKPKTWYGMPNYNDEAGKSIVFFQPAGKFKVRYSTLGFNPDAQLDDGEMWPSAFALLKITPAVEKRITALVRQAAGETGSSAT